MTDIEQRVYYLTLLQEAVDAGARQAPACVILGVSERTIQRWIDGESNPDQRSLRTIIPHNKLSDAEREQILTVVNSDEFAHKVPGQIVPALADHGKYIASESTIYRVLHSVGQQHHRSNVRPSTQRSKPRSLVATAPNQLYSWDITYLPTTIAGHYFYLYLFMDIFSK